MVAYVSSALVGWPSEEALSQENSSFISELNNCFWPNYAPVLSELNTTAAAAATTEPTKMGIKKLHHNASERDRRKKINSLYSSLRSLLPAPDQTKKLSIPSTVSQVIRYIPELQQQLERLSQKKKELSSKILAQNDSTPPPHHQQNQVNNNVHKNEHSTVVVSTNRIGDTEILVQISTCNNKQQLQSRGYPLISEILMNLENDGIVHVNSSRFESYQGGVFCSLHLQVEENFGWELESLSHKMVSLIEMRNVGFS